MTATVPMDTSSHNYAMPSQSFIPQGRLSIRVIEARNLNFARHPYCVVQFDKCEFISKEPIHITAQRHAPSQQQLAMMQAAQQQGVLAVPHMMDEVTVSPVWKHEATFDVYGADGEVTISIWDRAMSETEPERFLGMMKLRPPRIHGKIHDNWFRLLPKQWKENVRGEIRIQLLYRNITAKAVSAADFELLKVVGKGSFGKVLQVRKKDTGRVYAMKVLTKKHIVERQEIAHTLSERNVLIQATSPFLVNLRFSFQTPEKLYLVLDYMNGGELFYHLQKETMFTEERARFYTCQLTLALEHLHKYNIVYRDLKPENILLDSTGNIALTDFGLCKENIDYNDTTNTFCGTAEYLAPEVLTGQGYGKAVDWWSLGILFYEMISGLPPFYSENTNVMYKKILSTELTFPPHFSQPARSLCEGASSLDPRYRLGSSPADAAEVQSHPFFDGIDWDKMNKRQIQPPFKPKVESETDTSNFDPLFTEAMPIDSLPTHSAPLSETIQQNFKGFTYTGEQTFNDGSFKNSFKGSFRG